MPGAHCVVVGCTNSSDYKLWQRKEQWCPLYDINYGILEVYQLTPAKASVFSASYSSLDRMTTPDSSLHVRYSYEYDQSQSFHDVTITLSDIKCNKYDVFSPFSVVFVCPFNDIRSTSSDVDYPPESHEWAKFGF